MRLNKFTHIVRILTLSGLLYLQNGNASSLEAVQYHINESDFTTALALTGDILKLDQNNEELELLKGYILIQLARYDDAVTWYKKLIQRWVNNPEPANNLGVTYQLQGNYPEAIKTLMQLIERFPQYAIAHENLGDIYIALARESYFDGKNIASDNHLLSVKHGLATSFHTIALESAELSDESRDENLTNDSSNENIGDTAEPNHELLAALKSWRTDWSNKNTGKYFPITPKILFQRITIRATIGSHIRITFYRKLET